MKKVVFDFDGTLTKIDTLRVFAEYLSGIYGKKIKLLFFYFFLFLFRVGMISDRQLKEHFLKYFVKDRSFMEIEEKVKEFFGKNLEYLVNVSTLKKLRDHVLQGDKVYVISANFDFFLKPLIKIWNLTDVISTEASQIDGHFNGKITGNTCKGQAKIEKAKLFFGHDFKDIIVYADNEDVKLLNMAGRGINVSKESF